MLLHRSGDNRFDRLHRLNGHRGESAWWRCLCQRLSVGEVSVDCVWRNGCQGNRLQGLRWWFQKGRWGGLIIARGWSLWPVSHYLNEQGFQISNSLLKSNYSRLHWKSWFQSQFSLILNSDKTIWKNHYHFSAPKSLIIPESLIVPEWLIFIAIPNHSVQSSRATHMISIGISSKFPN